MPETLIKAYQHCLRKYKGILASLIMASGSPQEITLNTVCQIESKAQSFTIYRI